MLNAKTVKCADAVILNHGTTQRWMPVWATRIPVRVWDIGRRSMSKNKPTNKSPIIKEKERFESIEEVFSDPDSLKEMKKMWNSQVEPKNNRKDIHREDCIYCRRCGCNLGMVNKIRRRRRCGCGGYGK